jgi:hypothetical protein
LEQCQIENVKIKERDKNQYPLTNKYMTLHLPVMVHTLQDKVAWLTLSRIKNVNKNQGKKRGTQHKFKSSLNI